MKSYNNISESVMGYKTLKELWDFNIKTDILIDIAVLGDKRIEEKEKEKIENYADLDKEVKKTWNMSLCKRNASCNRST